MKMYFTVALRNLLQAKRRTTLLCLALAFVSMLLVALLSLSRGLSETMLQSATTLVSGHVNVGGFYKAKVSDDFPLITETQKLREMIKANVKDLDYMVDRGRGWGKLVSETSSLQIGISGIDIKEETHFIERLELAEEKSYRENGKAEVVGDPKQLAEPNTVLIFAAQAKRLGVSVGDTLTITSETAGGKINTSDVRVVAVAKDVGYMSNWNVFVPKQVVLDLYQLNPDTSGFILIYLKDPSQHQKVMGELREVFSKANFRLMEYQSQPFWMKFEQVSSEDWTGQKLDLTTWEDEVSYMKWTIDALDTISFVLVTILVLIISVGIMNATFMSVRERTQEIGTLRAIGMTRTQVLYMFIAEAFLLGIFATFLGGYLGYAIAKGLDAYGIPITNEAIRMVLMSDTLHLAVYSKQLFASSIAFTVVTILAALWPALRAARLQPVTAIHNIG